MMKRGEWREEEEDRKAMMMMMNAQDMYRRPPKT
jgi:hypothetical protein